MDEVSHPFFFAKKSLYTFTEFFLGASRFSILRKCVPVIHYIFFVIARKEVIRRIFSQSQ